MIARPFLCGLQRGLVAACEPTNCVAKCFCPFVVRALDTFADAGACCCLVHVAVPSYVLLVLMSSIWAVAPATTNETFYYFS